MLVNLSQIQNDNNELFFFKSKGAVNGLRKVNIEKKKK